MLLKTWDSEKDTGKMVQATVVLSREEIDLILGDSTVDEFGMSAWDRFIREERVDLCKEYRGFLKWRDEMRKAMLEFRNTIIGAVDELVTTDGK